MKKLSIFLMLMALFGPWAAFGQQNQETLTVYDGTSSCLNIPMLGTSFDAYAKSECIIPATALTDMDGATITAITFYPQDVNSSTWSGSKQTVFLKEVSSTNLGGSYSGTDGATIVKESSPLPMPIVNQAYTITFDTPYTYNGGNLLIGVYNVVRGWYNSVAWWGTWDVPSGVSAYGSNSNSLSNVPYNAQHFLPKTTFTYNLSGYKVKVGTMSHGSIQFNTGGNNWYDHLVMIK